MRLQSMILAMSAISTATAACAGRKHSSSSTAVSATSVASTLTPTTLSTTSASSTSVSSTASSSAPTASSSVSSNDLSSDSSSSADTVTGEATFYGGNLSGGTCSFTTMTSLPAGIFGTAYSGSAWDNAAECGACLQVTGPNGSIKVMVVDECPECDVGHLDLFEDAFAEIGDTSAGIIDISYVPVDCDISSPIVLHNKSGTSAYWFSMQVVNANGAVDSLEVSTDGGSTWQSTTRTDYNFFENTSGFGTDTVDVRVTSASGSTVTVNSVGVSSDSTINASSNF